MSNQWPAGRMWPSKPFVAARKGIFNQTLHQVELLHCIQTFTISDVCGPPKFLRSVYGLSSENPAVYGLSPVLSAVRVGEITAIVVNNRNFSRSLKLVSIINCARCEMRRAISVCMQLCIYLSLCINYVSYAR